jgi:hypothetical protein
VLEVRGVPPSMEDVFIDHLAGAGAV